MGGLKLDQDYWGGLTDWWNSMAGTGGGSGGPESVTGPEHLTV